MDYEERRMRGETGHAREGVERATEDITEGAREVRRGMYGAQDELGRMAERGREAATATRERVSEFTGGLRVEPRWMWVVGAITVVGGIVAAFTLFTPRRVAVPMPRARDQVWNTWLQNFGDRLIRFGRDLKSTAR